MIQRLLTLYLPAAAVVTIATVAGVFLYQTNDPELEEVAFVAATNDVGITETAEQTSEDAEAEGEGEGIIGDTEVGIAEHNEITVDAEGIAESAEQKPEDTETVVVEPTVELTVVTISGPGVSKRCELELTEAKTAHQVMKQAADQCDFSYQWEKYASLGVFVDGLGGVLSDKSAGVYWIYYVNGTKANVGVSSYTIASGDELLWKYEQEY